MLSPEIFSLVIIPILIFLARIADVSIGTIRIIYVSKGVKYLAPIFGFAEVIIWLTAIQQIFLHLNNPIYFIAYSLGFAVGTFVGISIEERISVGKVIVRVVTKKGSRALYKELQQAGFTITTVGARNHDGNVRIILTVIKKKHVNRALKIIRNHEPRAFYSVEDVRFAFEEAVMPQKGRFRFRHWRHTK